MTTEGSTTGILLGNKTYDRAKFLVEIFLPALAVLYASLSEFWGFPKVQEVCGSIGAVALFLGIVMKISSSNFEPSPTAPTGGTPVGTFVVTQDVNGKKSVRMDLDRDPEEFIDNDAITFNLAKETLEEDVREENGP